MCNVLCPPQTNPEKYIAGIKHYIGGPVQPGDPLAMIKIPADVFAQLQGEGAVGGGGGGGAAKPSKEMAALIDQLEHLRDAKNGYYFGSMTEVFTTHHFATVANLIHSYVFTHDHHALPGCARRKTTISSPGGIKGWLHRCILSMTLFHVLNCGCGVFLARFCD